uniref:Uncharacterized protein n=1 Tax=Anopheles atroparvus TaxID=41427 RepID=A0A182INL0_ANOAO
MINHFSLKSRPKATAMQGRRQHMGGWTTAAANAKQNGLSAATAPSSKSATTSPDRLRGATHDLFELLERVQCSRLDDQRCVLPSYFTQYQFANKSLAPDISSRAANLWIVVAASRDDEFGLSPFV